MSTRLTIDIWYGTNQRFGHAGVSQRWVNLLGRVAPPDEIKSLHYTLNGEDARALTVGADKRRLAAPGDFNIDVDIRRLRQGENQVKITAIATDGEHTTETITLTYAPRPTTLPVHIDWQAVSSIQDVAHVADGRWALTTAGISPQEIGYDRTVALGDMAWQDYEVTVPITIHGINAACYEYPSWHAGVGVVMRWKGHANWGSDGWASGQPVFGPSPYGAIGWYCIFQEHGPELNFFDPDFQRIAVQPRLLEWHRPYLFRVRVTTLGTVTSRYQMRVWPQDGREPSTWDLDSEIEHIGFKEGAVLLVAHHTAAVFGNVTIRSVK